MEAAAAKRLLIGAAAPAASVTLVEANQVEEYEEEGGSGEIGMEVLVNMVELFDLGDDIVDAAAVEKRTRDSGNSQTESEDRSRHQPYKRTKTGAIGREYQQTEPPAQQSPRENQQGSA